MLTLPLDVQELIFASCDPLSLTAFSVSSRLAHTLTHSHGWPAWNRLHNARHFRPITASLPHTPALQVGAVDRAAFCHRVDRAWDRKNLCFERLGLSFPYKVLPVLLLHEEARRIYVGAGTLLSVILFEKGRPIVCKPVKLAGHAHEDITGLAPVATCPDDLIVSHLSGRIVRLRLSIHHSAPPHRRGRTSSHDFEVSVSAIAHFDQARHPRTQALHGSGGLFASAAHTSSKRRGGIVSLSTVRSPWTPPSQTTLSTRPWAVHLDDASSSTPRFLAVGHAGGICGSLYPLSESGIVPEPARFSSTEGSPSAGYAVAQSYAQPDLIAVGQYDGAARLFDIRGGGKRKESGEMEAVMHLREPFCDSPAYSVAIGGGHGALVAAGSARNSSIRVYDTRFTAEALNSFSLFAGRSRSSVFGLAFEHSRLFGAIEDDAFMIEADPVARRWSARGEPVRYWEHGDSRGKLLQAKTIP